MEKVKDDQGRVVKAGGIIVRTGDGGMTEYLVIFRGNHGDYSFPKGHLEQGETLEEGVKREVAEETGLLTEIVKTLKPEEYFNTKSLESTILHMFQLKIISGQLKIENEGDRLIWADAEELHRLLHPKLFAYFKEVVGEIDD